MNSKLTNIETKNSSLETSLSQIEKKITAIWQIRDLNRVTSYGQVNKVESLKDHEELALIWLS